MATWDATQLATATLQVLGIVGVGQTASAEHTKRVTDAWNSVYPQLRREGVAQWTSAAISEEAQRPLAKYMAGQLAVELGFTGARLQAIMFDAQAGWQELNVQAAGDVHHARKTFKDY
jgi:hypothetical protein